MSVSVSLFQCSLISDHCYINLPWSSLRSLPYVPQHGRSVCEEGKPAVFQCICQHFLICGLSFPVYFGLSNGHYSPWHSIVIPHSRRKKRRAKCVSVSISVLSYLRSTFSSFFLPFQRSLLPLPQHSSSVSEKEMTGNQGKTEHGEREKRPALTANLKWTDDRPWRIPCIRGALSGSPSPTKLKILHFISPRCNLAKEALIR